MVQIMWSSETCQIRENVVELWKAKWKLVKKSLEAKGWPFVAVVCGACQGLGLRCKKSHKKDPSQRLTQFHKDHSDHWMKRGLKSDKNQQRIAKRLLKWDYGGLEQDGGYGDMDY